MFAGIKKRILGRAKNWIGAVESPSEEPPADTPPEEAPAKEAPASSSGTGAGRRPCALRWSYSVCECDMQLGAFKADRIRASLIRVLEAEGIQYVDGVDGTDAHFAVPVESIEVLERALAKDGLQYEVTTLPTAINTYDFPASSEGFRYSDLVPSEYEQILVIPTYFCKQRRKDALAMATVVTTFTDTHNTRLFHSSLATARTKLLDAGQASPAHPRSNLGLSEPIDVVITTVDGSDPAWRQKFRQILQERGDKAALDKTTNEGRYSNHDELRFLLRSLHYYAPYVRTIHIVTDDQSPAWLDTAHPRINLVDHREIIDPVYLPTFNSDAIESCLWRIPGLSERFIYFNDDILLMSPTSESTFFTPNGDPRFGRSNRRLPDIPVELAAAYTVHAHLQTAEALTKRGFTRPTYKFKHIPFAGRKHIFEEIEIEFAEELHRTRRSPIRSEDSFATISFLYPHFALATSRAELAQVSDMYIDFSAETWRESLLDACARTNLAFTCVNESTDARAGEAVDEYLRETLSARFPVVPPWETASTNLAGGRGQ